MLHLASTPYTLHFRKPAPTSRGALTTRAIWFIRASYDEAPESAGWGECGPLPGLSRDDTPTFGAAVERFCAEFNRARHADVNSALATVQQAAGAWPSLTFGVETALLDLASGGRQRLWDTPFARGECGLPTHGLIWMDTPDGILRQIETKVASGFHVIKMKIGALPFAEEIALLRIVRDAFPAVELRLDANGAFAPHDALHRLDELAAFDVAFIEQPIRRGQWGVLGELCRHSPIPIALDEELISITTAGERDALLSAVRPQVLIVKPALLGGFAVCQAWIADAHARSIQWFANSLLESNIGLNAICQWTSACGGTRVHGLGTGSLFTNNVAGPLCLRDSQLVVQSSLCWELDALAGVPSARAGQPASIE